MKEICEEGRCAGCMACAELCPKDAVQIFHDRRHYWPVIDQTKCIDCGACKRVCQQLHPAEGRIPVSWYQGWATDDSERASSSSGGIASAIARSFARSGGVVCACSFEDGRLSFSTESDPSRMDRFKGSKYVKSDPTGSYREVKWLLSSGKKVLFVGLPCQVSAMLNFVGPGLQDSLYTIDLICHGTPSPDLLAAFLQEQGIELADLRSISFRRKTRFHVDGDGEEVDAPGVVDRYLVAFLSGISYTEACYACPYASERRTSDLTLGDSWGSELVEEMDAGISLILCQTEKGETLLREAMVHLEPVDVTNAVANNGQLRAPSHRPSRRDQFLADLRAGRSFHSSVFRALPRECLRQDIKRLLVRFSLWKPSGGGYQMTLYPKAREAVTNTSLCDDLFEGGHSR